MCSSNKVVTLSVVACILLSQISFLHSAYAEPGELGQEQSAELNVVDEVEEAADEENGGSIAIDGEASPDSGAPIVDNTANGFIENSWRYENGVLRTGLEPEVRAIRATGTLPAGATGWGIDVSSHQGVIDWAKVKAAGVDFAILRVGFGSGGTDSQFKANVEGCKKYNIPFGVYLYSYAWDADSARSEANWTLNVLSSAGVKASDMKLPVYYDLENTVGNKEHPDYGKPAGVDSDNQYHVISDKAAFAAMANAYCSTIKSAGYQPGVYASLNWWRTYLTDKSFNSWDRWVAQYYSECTYQGAYSLWQYSSVGAVDGINGNVDVNYCYASFKNLGWYKANGTWYYGQFDGTNKTGWLLYKESWYWLNPSANGAMATGITLVEGKRYFLDPAAGGAMRTGWISYQSKRYYAGSSGVLFEGWNKIGGTWYYFDIANSCAMKTGWLLDGSTWYYLSESGAMQTGWQKVGSTWYYLRSSGAMVTGWLSLGGHWYYLSESGAMRIGTFFDGSKYSSANQSGHWLGYCNGWIKVNANWYYVDKGTPRVGWSRIGEKWYWFDSQGVMQTGWIVDSSKTWYFLTSSGAMKTGWLAYGGNWYYLQSNGAMVTGWKTIGGKTYYFYSNGVMATGLFEVNGVPYYADSNGAVVKNTWVSLDNGTQVYAAKNSACSLFVKNGIAYRDSSCSSVLKGSMEVDDALFHADESTGAISTGLTVLPGGAKYYFDSKTYKAQTGWKQLGGVWYYFDPSTRAMCTGWKKVKSSWYLLASSGAMLTGWQQVDGDWYYLDPSSGAMHTGWQKVSSSWYLLASSGEMLTGWQKVGKNYYYLDSGRGGAMLTGTHTIDGHQRRFSSNGAVDKYGWQNPVQYYQVSCQNVRPYKANAGIYSYVSPSKISADASRQQVIEAFIQRAYDYLGTKYVWDYACAPGVGVDCSGLVNQCFYAVGMDTIYNPYQHAFDPWQDHNAENMRVDSRLKNVPINERQRGDLIFYKGHVAIYLGNGRIIHATPPRVVISDINISGLTILGVKRPFVE